MTPLTSALLGLLFLAIGATATVLMCVVRGYQVGTRRKPPELAPSDAIDADAADPFVS